MEKKQFNFKNIKGMLSRDEMKRITGGYDGYGGPYCSTKDCEWISGGQPHSAL